MTETDDATLLQRFHTKPGQTTLVFEPFRTDNGRSSYEVLAGEASGLPGGAAVLDLACGDGFLLELLAAQGGHRLVGVDLSAAELAAARERVGPSVELFCGNATDLPLPDASINLVVCHMAFMLMDPVDSVLREIRRVLKPGGRFAAIINRPHSDPVFDVCWGETRRATADAGLDRLQMGAPDIYTEQGLRGHLRLHFEEPSITVEDFVLRAQLTPELVWRFVESTYTVFRLPIPHQEALRQKLLPMVTALAGKSGTLTTEMGMRLFTCQTPETTPTDSSP